jgi:DNA-binding transcriptional MocR family regulator
LPTTRAEPRYRYQELASFITALVDRGTLPPGSRVPSLREISEQRRVSVTTALQAYRLLEDRGVIEARPQSGFYVARGGPVSIAPPAMSDPPARASHVAVSSLVLRLLEYAADPALVPLGCAVPGAALLGAVRLDRFLARAARVHGVDYNNYTPPRGDPRLRREIARRATRWGQVLSPDDIAITCGCTEALMLALRAVTRPGDTVAIESPTYFGILQVIESLELKALELPTDPESGVDVASLARALERRSIKACLLSSSFNNPLGCTMPEASKRAVLDLLARRGVPLIEDDIYGDIYFGDERPRPFIALDQRGNTIYCSSFSKTLAPGYRVGWIATGRHLQKVLATKFATTLCGPALPQAALADFLASGGHDSHLRRIRGVFRDSVDRMTRAIDRSFPAGTRVTRPAGGFVLWLELPRPFRSRDAFERAVQAGVCFAPGDVFSASDRYARCMRLSCGHPWSARIERGIETLGALASAALAGP